ncbi:hypothetical protein M404DRAFT_722430 [Pisolithus tinctorius Marx 270]|uniref:Crinkler effector protein N-terminal domain-containing protein n=1 Tax=Pisolithus tinctorius Marx 270 TaxID=870435 RepID=A0A0C3P2Z1_PISTI|nr:hypothetical protein M404DRAFT_722430 [Pisolithus tinctorius Marx 270]
MSDGFKLSYWVRGTPSDTSFDVTISPTERVNTLRQLIQETQRFDVLAGRLRLFKLKPYVETLNGVTLSEHGELLYPSDKISEVFTAQPPTRHIHIIVDAPYPWIYYWLRGTDASEERIVRIRSDASVIALKQQIQNSDSDLRDLPESSIRLFRISEGHLRESLNTDNDGTLLNGRQKIFACFEGTTVLETFCLVVQLPRQDVITLNCWIIGEDIRAIFGVKVAMTQTVYDLKRLIKGENAVALHTTDARLLTLWNVSLLCDDALKQAIEGLDLPPERSLHSVKRLSTIFAEPPVPEHLHIIVGSPHAKQGPPLHPQHCVSAQRGAFLAQFKPKALSSIVRPSEFFKFQVIDGQTIYCNRPADAVAIIPPTLLHRAFGDFLHDCDVVELTSEDNFFVMKLHTVMSNRYDDEQTCAVQLRELFEGWGLTFMPSATHHGYMTGGDMREGEYRYAIAEIKNEVGSTQADPYNQATFHYVEFSRQYAETMALSPLPCFIILLFGPLIMFAGAVWNVCPVIQPLSFVLPLHYHPTDTYMQTEVARHLKAFKNAVVMLEGYYRSLSLNNNPSCSHHSQLFPYPTSFKPLGSNANATKEFKYTSQYPNKLIFFGTLAGEPICIKFVRHYSVEVHRFSASRGRAPALHGFDTLHGGWYMVVMDSLDGYKDLCDVDPPPLVFERIRTHLDELHQHGYVHGDVRSMNIMVLESDMTEFMFIDFDWAGKIGEVRYPLNVNREIWRPSGVFDWAPIEAKHDMAMLKHIIASFDKGDKRREDDQTQSEDVDERESKRPRLTKSPSTSDNRA